MNTAPTIMLSRRSAAARQPTLRGARSPFTVVGVAAVSLIVVVGCARDVTDVPVPNPPHGMTGHDHSRMHAVATDGETESGVP